LFSPCARRQALRTAAASSVGTLPQRLVEALRAVVGQRDAEPLALEGLLEHLGLVAIVLYQKDAQAFHRHGKKMESADVTCQAGRGKFAQRIKF
jgi:hypothetical protein